MSDDPTRIERLRTELERMKEERDAAREDSRMWETAAHKNCGYFHETRQERDALKDEATRRLDRGDRLAQLVQKTSEERDALKRELGCMTQEMDTWKKATDGWRELADDRLVQYNDLYRETVSLKRDLGEMKVGFVTGRQLGKTFSTIKEIMEVTGMKCPGCHEAVAERDRLQELLDSTTAQLERTQRERDEKLVFYKSRYPGWNPIQVHLVEEITRLHRSRHEWKRRWALQVRLKQTYQGKVFDLVDAFNRHTNASPIEGSPTVPCSADIDAEGEPQ
jgi:hypothetical protein